MANYFDNFLLSGDCCCLKGAMIVITFCCCRCCGCGSHGDRCSPNCNRIIISISFFFYVFPFDGRTGWMSSQSRRTPEFCTAFYWRNISKDRHVWARTRHSNIVTLFPRCHHIYLLSPNWGPILLTSTIITIATTSQTWSGLSKWNTTHSWCLFSILASILADIIHWPRFYSYIIVAYALWLRHSLFRMRPASTFLCDVSVHVCHLMNCDAGMNDGGDRVALNQTAVTMISAPRLRVYWHVDVNECWNTLCHAANNTPSHRQHKNIVEYCEWLAQCQCFIHSTTPLSYVFFFFPCMPLSLSLALYI